MKSQIKKLIRRLVVPCLPQDPHKDLATETLIQKAMHFAACEMIEGDYLEFGVFRGSSFIHAYKTAEREFKQRIALDIGGENAGKQRIRRQKIWDSMRFIAFDSFEGLPSLASGDETTPDFTAGMYACSQDQFITNVTAAGVPRERFIAVKGFFEASCTPETKAAITLNKAAVVWIDADLYSSTLTALNFVSDVLQDGTILIFDDWFSFRGSPNQGEQRAFREWAASPLISQKFTFQEYQRETWKRMSFVTSLKL